MKRLILLCSIVLLILAYGISLSLMKVTVVEEELDAHSPTGLFDYRGVINVHSNLGLGTGSLQDIAKAAIRANLDFVILTDHNLFSLPSAPSGYHRQLLVFSAAQLSYLDAQLLVLDRQAANFESIGQAQTALADRLSQSNDDPQQNIMVLGHPLSRDQRITKDGMPGLDGVEVINLKSLWEQAWRRSPASLFWSLMIYPFNARLALLRLFEEPEAELQLWDFLAVKRPTIGLAGSEATAKAGPIGSFFLEFPSYETSFALVSNHLLLPSELTGEADTDIRKLRQAIASGQFYFSVDVLGNPKGFNTHLQVGEKTWPMGSEVKFKPGMKLNAQIPRKPSVPFEISFLKDGQHMMSSNSTEATYDIQGPGTYRVIVRVIRYLTVLDGQRWLTWIYSNPFYVR